MFSCILSCVLSLYRWGPLAASHLYCNARRVYNPLLARATSHLGEHCGPPLSLDGIQRPALFTGHTHTHTHTQITLETPHTCYPNQITPPSLHPALCFPVSLSCRCPLLRVKRWANREAKSLLAITHRGDVNSTLTSEVTAATMWTSWPSGGR